MVSAPESADRLARHKDFIDAAAEAGVRHIVYLSFMNAAPDCVFTLGRTHFHTEEHIKASGMAWTFLRDNFYIDFFVDLPDEEGVIRGPAGDGRVGAVARSDAGRVAAAVLRDPGRHVGRTLNVTGPSSLTLDEIAEILTGALGRPIRYERETVDEAYESRKKWPVEQWQYDAWVSTYTSIAAGQMDVVSTVVEDLTGRPPLSVRDVAEAGVGPPGPIAPHWPGRGAERGHSTRPGGGPGLVVCAIRSTALPRRWWNAAAPGHPRGGRAL